MGIIEVLKNKNNNVAMELIKYSSDLQVLYAEDDEILRKNTLVFLRDVFIKVDEASNGIEALGMYKNHKYDILITDLTMPGEIDGFDLVKSVRKENNEQAVVVITAHEEQKIFLEAIILGIDGFLLKPMNFTVFISTLTKVSKQVVAMKEKKERDLLLRENLELSRKRFDELSTLVSISLDLDSLTRLLSRRSLDTELVNTKTKNKSGTALLIDIDRFNHINKVYGIDYGDQLLQHFAKRLQAIIKTEFHELNINLYRLESDKFIVIIYNSSHELEEKFIKTVNLNMKNSFKLANSSDIKVSVFLSILTNIENHNDVILKLISAMTERKANREDSVNYIYFNEKSPFLRKQSENILWMHRLKHIVRERDVYPIFQPIVDNKTLQIVKYETLMRIKYDDEIISPAKFIEPATVLGLLPELTKILIDKTFNKLQHSHVDFTINISEEDIHEGYLKTYISNKLAEYNIDPHRITFEILEQMTTGSSVIDHLKFFKDIGVNIAIDDFGSERSNFSRLSFGNIHTIKIDGMFIKDLDQNKQNLKIVKSIAFLAKELNCQVVAEFVHNKEIFELVRDLGVEYSQGYYFGAPTFEPKV